MHKILYNKEVNIISTFSPKSVLAKGVFAVFVFLFFFLASAFLLNYKTEEELLVEKLEKTVPMTAEEKTIVTQKLQELSKDSDKDGLKDWEEIIYRTDSQNADTDGDGTKDGEEIKENRNPLVKGPKDSNITASNVTTPENNPDLENNLTYNFVQKIYNIAGPSISSGGSIEEGALESLVSEMSWADADKVLNDIPSAVKITDLVISPKNDPDSVKKYFNSVNEVYVNLGLLESDVEIFARALETKDFGELEKLDKIIAGLDKSFREIKKMPVPAGYEDFAVRELNYNAKTKYVIEKLKTAETDPLNALIMFQARAKIINDVIDFHSGLGKELAQKGIIFGQKESGYALLQMIQ